MKSALAFGVAALSLGSGAVFGLDTAVSASNLRVERFIPLADLSRYPELRVPGVNVVDPLAVYSNATNFLGSTFAQGPAASGITRLVMDDLTFTTNPGVGTITAVRFSVANLNATTQSVRMRLRFWNADGPSLGAGLANGPGTYYSPGGTPIGFTFDAIPLGAGVSRLLGVVSFALPAGVTTTLWAGVTFDNVGTTTGATETELSNFGQAFFQPVDLGSSTNTIFETTTAGSFFATDNPVGAALSFGGSPVANQDWELMVTTLPVELSTFSVE